MLNRAFLLIFLTSFSFCSYSQDYAKASGRLKPYKTENPIIIDGVLNEPSWQKALFSDKMYDEEDSVNYSTSTRTYFTYDADNLYVAFICQVNDISLLSETKFDKDDQRILENEWIAFCVDTYDDGIAAYVFIVDAAGNQLTILDFVQVPKTSRTMPLDT